MIHFLNLSFLTYVCFYHLQPPPFLSGNLAYLQYQHLLHFSKYFKSFLIHHLFFICLFIISVSKDDTSKPCKLNSFLGYKVGITHIVRELEKHVSSKITLLFITFQLCIHIFDIHLLFRLWLASIFLLPFTLRRDTNMLMLNIDFDIFVDIVRLHKRKTCEIVSIKHEPR